MKTNLFFPEIVRIILMSKRSKGTKRSKNRLPNQTFQLFNLSTFQLTFIFAFFLLPSALFSQAPQGFNYQAVLRDAQGQVVKDQLVSLRLSILQGSETGTTVYSETHQVTSNAFGLVTVVVGEGNVVTGEFDAVDWEAGPYYLKVEVDLTGGSNYVTLGVSALQSVPYALQAGTVGSLTRLEVQGDDTDSDSALFVVRRKDGQIVFAVYNEGVRIYVDTASGGKGPQRGGFAIGGFDFGKGISHEYLRVTPDSVRIYIDDSESKGPHRGGFAIGGFDFGKGSTREYLRVTDDSTRVYVKQADSKGPRRGGFAIGGFDFGKGDGETEYFNVSTSSSAEVIRGENRVLWYPLKNAFLVGRVLVESPDSVGTNSFSAGYETKAVGEYSQALGYNAHAGGDNATAIGNNAVASGMASYAFGNYARAGNNGSYALGSGAQAAGWYSFAIGSTGVDSADVVTGATQAIGDYAYAFGMGCLATGRGAFSLGTQNIASGPYSMSLGYNTRTKGYYSTAMGAGTEAGENYATAMGFNTKALGNASLASGAETVASGVNSTAMGWHNIAAGMDAVAMGLHTTAGGEESVAMGGYTSASAQNAVAMGSGTKAEGVNATAMGSATTAGGSASLATGAGTNASGTSAVTTGFYSSAEGDDAMATGYYTSANAFCSFAAGRFNIINSASKDTWVESDPLFTIGNGSYSYRHNAMLVKKNGEVYFPDVYFQPVGTPYEVLYIDNTGKIGYLSSSRRYKKKIRSMEDPGWLYRLHPVNFVYKNDEEGQKQYGLIAEEVEKVNPLFVSYNKKGQVETVSYSKLITPMLKALQEQREVIEKQGKEIERLKSEKQELASLRQEVEELKQILGAMAEK